MPLPKTLTSALRTAIAISFSLIGMTACSDVTAPVGGIDRAAVARVMPAVADSRLRLSTGLGNVSIRQRVILDISDLEIALRSGDATMSRSLVRKVSAEVTDYRAQSSFSEGADMSAIFLMLQAVSQVVDPGSVVSP